MKKKQAQVRTVRKTTVKTGPPDPDKLKSGFKGNGKKDVAYWKQRFLESEERVRIWTERAKVLEHGQMLTADKLAPDEVQKLHDRVNELEDKLLPFDYEFLHENMLIKVVVRPRTQEVFVVK